MFQQLARVMILWGACAHAMAAPLLKPNAPNRYVVAPGDTLWAVAEQFLQDPWQWSALWADEASARHGLRPGDVLTLSRSGGMPRLLLNAGLAGQPRVIKLSPQIRATALTEIIPTIPLQTIRTYLASPRVLSDDDLDDAPYIVSVRDAHRAASAGEKIYVRGLSETPPSHYSVFRAGMRYQDGESGENLGREAIPVGDAVLQQIGDPATLLLTRNDREAMPGDRLLPMEEMHLPNGYAPHAPEPRIHGSIVGVLGGVPNHLPNVGPYSIIVIDKGLQDGLEEGHVLQILQRGGVVLDRVTQAFDKSVRLPDEIVGTVLLFRLFTRVSYGLVMRANAEISLGDRVQTP